MEKIPAAPGHERPFPNPINVNAHRCGEHEQDKNEREAPQSSYINPDYNIGLPVAF
jgi:hypothetical protein